MNNIKELYGEAIIDSRDSEELNIGERIKLEYYKQLANSLRMETEKHME